MFAKQHLLARNVIGWRGSSKSASAAIRKTLNRYFNWNPKQSLHLYKSITRHLHLTDRQKCHNFFLFFVTILIEICMQVSN